MTSAGASLSDDAQHAWAMRDQPDQTEKAIGLWQEALRANPDQPELWIPLTQAMNRASRRATKKSVSKAWADQARETGKMAVSKNPGSAAAHVYYAEALGQYANAHKGLASLKHVKHAVQVLKQAVALDPKYGYAHTLLSEFYRGAPAGISVGNKKKALEEARRAVELEPDRAINHLSYARALKEQGQKGAAIEQLRFVLAMTARPDLVPETKANQADAATLLACYEGRAKGKHCD